MRFGLPGGRGSLDPGAAVTTLDLARTAEKQGYDWLWLSEEHFGATSGATRRSRPSVLVLAAATAAVTEKVRIGFSCLFPSLHDPIRLAEDIATLDRLSAGRIDLGIGWPSDLYMKAFGRQPRTGDVAAALEAMLAYWSKKPIEVEGRTYTVEPGLVQMPAPPILVQAHDEASIAWAAARNYRLLLSAFQTDTSIQTSLTAFEARGGRVADSPVAKFCLVAPTDAQARELAWPLVTALCDRLRKSGLEEQANKNIAGSDLDPEHFYRETAIIGSPATVIGRIEELKQIGVRCINLRPSFWGSCPLPVQQNTTKLFAEAVMPHVR
jgi:alkanesulfonate monooxygenase SsuD/methylene tetrahydromethanopterin reductase-like flavin-dependent oxidoreductase (luciferase family)